MQVAHGKHQCNVEVPVGVSPGEQFMAKLSVPKAQAGLRNNASQEALSAITVDEIRDRVKRLHTPFLGQVLSLNSPPRPPSLRMRSATASSALILPSLDGSSPSSTTRPPSLRPLPQYACAFDTTALVTQLKHLHAPFPGQMPSLSSLPSPDRCLHFLPQTGAFLLFLPQTGAFLVSLPQTGALTFPPTRLPFLASIPRRELDGSLNRHRPFPGRMP